MSIFSHRHSAAAGTNSEIRPVRDWFLLLGATALLVSLSVGWNLWLFSRVTQGGTLGSAPAEPAPELGIEGITDEFAERAYERSRYEVPGRFADPSR